MKKTRWFNFLTLSGLVVVGLFLLPACNQEDIVHQKSLAELNQKAQQMLQAGDVNGAVARLEAAHDLSPNEDNTTFNLAIAYQMQGSHDKAIVLFQQLLAKPGQDQGELYKNLGITYEAKADGLDSAARELEKDPKADKSQIATLKQQSMESYQLAKQNYEQAVSKVKNSDQIQKQITLIQSKLEHPEGPTANEAVSPE